MAPSGGVRLPGVTLAVLLVTVIFMVCQVQYSDCRTIDEMDFTDRTFSPEAVTSEAPDAPSESTNFCKASFEPPVVGHLLEGQRMEIPFNLSCRIEPDRVLSNHNVTLAGSSQGSNSTWSAADLATIQIRITSRDPSIARIEGPTVLTFNTSISSGVKDGHNDYIVEDSGNFTLIAELYGRTHLELRTLGLAFPPGSGSSRDLVSVLEVTVVHSDGVLSLVFVAILGAMILLYNFGFGCKVKAALIVGIIKRPVAPAIGFCCQFLLMAPLSFALAKLLGMDDIAGLGLLAIGCSPGGGGSNVFAYLLDGDLELSITMTFISTLASLGMTPLWIWALGRYFTDGSPRTVIPVANVFASLALVTIPVAVGIIVNHFKPHAAKKIAWCLKPATAIIGTVFITLGIYVYYYALVRVTWPTLVACVIVPLIGYCTGAAAGKIFRQDKPKWITISLETGFQNLALALLILSTSLQEPESDLASVVPICYAFLSAAIPSVVFLVKLEIRLYNHVRGVQKSEALSIPLPEDDISFTNPQQPNHDDVKTAGYLDPAEAGHNNLL